MDGTVKLATMQPDHDESDFDNERDDWQDDLRRFGDTSLSPDQVFWVSAPIIFLTGMCVVSVVVVTGLVAVELWRIFYG